ncbi:hypothetical protein MKW94_007183 [Papaver nudicaule]|uniref:BHLH domain-containing protein n=1 Tax=Papaver nudicaule TaxID=74823 RepID=A0AA41S405_PAPNU|nr:hypothetical protein [Papaver nudicaule]
MEKEYFMNNSRHNSPPQLMDIQIGHHHHEQFGHFLNLNWDNSMDQNAPFESALSSIVSSPVGSNSSSVPPQPNSENVVIRELIGRLGSICNSGEISPHSGYINVNNGGNGNNSTNTSCYSTPLNSPPKLNLSMMDHQLRGNLANSTAQTHHPSLAPLAPFPSDPGFAERAARLSCFGTRTFGNLSAAASAQFGLNEAELSASSYRSNNQNPSEKLSRVSSSQSLKATGSHQENPNNNTNSTSTTTNKDFSQLQDMILDNEMRSRLPSRLSSRSTTPEKHNGGEFTQEDSSISEQIPEIGLKVSNDHQGGNGRKRKAASKGKAKETPSTKDVKTAEVDNSDAKKSKSGDNDEKTNSGEGSQKNNGKDQKPPEPPKDYIHVRARRGQATDSHSLAERVRREKISERMKFLQDLVPGCNKVTGKAVMLDEIINYVQSLQRQVEFLSMKLSTVNPRLDFNMEALLSKDILQPRGPFAHPNYPIDTFPYGHQPSQHVQNLQPQLNGTTNETENHCPLDAALRRNLGMQLPSLDGFCESAAQLGAFWEDDLQSVVQMGFGHNQGQETGYHSQNSHGLPSTHMKVEL